MILIHPVSRFCLLSKLQVRSLILFIIIIFLIQAKWVGKILAEPHIGWNWVSKGWSQWNKIRGMIVSYLNTQLAVLYTYNCLPILRYLRLGQSLLISNKFAVRSLYSWWPIKLVKDYSSSPLHTLTSLNKMFVSSRPKSRFWKV